MKNALDDFYPLLELYQKTQLFLFPRVQMLLTL